MRTRLLDPSANNVALAAARLREGQIVAMPTETVYGLAAVAFDEHAVAAVYQAKARPSFDPIIVHVACPSGWSRFQAGERIDLLARSGVVDPTPLDSLAKTRAEVLMGAFWPGPLTLVLPRGPRIPDLVTSGLDTVAIRMPRHPVAQALLAATGLPLAAPSANRFGRISPTSAADVEAELSGRVAIILDGGPCEVGLESTVLAVSPNGDLTVLRPGGVPRERIVAAVGAPVALAGGAIATAPLVSPGLLDVHYAPSKPLRLLPGPLSALGPVEAEAMRAELPLGKAPIGLLVARGEASAASLEFERLIGRPTIAFSLSRDGDAEEAARALFRSLRALDDSDAAVLFAEPWPEGEGLGFAIADRLRRASRGGQREPPRSPSR